MPYQTPEYTPPSLPEVVSNLKTFEDVRTAVGRIMEYLQRVQAANVLYFQHLRENLNQAATTQGLDFPAQDTVTVTKFMHIVTGTGTIRTINGPLHFAGQLMLFAQDGFYVATGGNINLFTSPNFIQANSHIMLNYVPSRNLWYTDSCRLQNTVTSLIVGGRQVVTQ